MAERYPVAASDLERAEQRAGLSVESGDALIVRGGWGREEHIREPVPHISLDAVRWMAERQIALYAGDIGDEPPSRNGDLWLHAVALPRLGLPLIDVPNVSPVTETCHALGRSSFLFVLGAMPVPGATGVPVNPLAIF